MNAMFEWLFAKTPKDTAPAAQARGVQSDCVTCADLVAGCGTADKLRGLYGHWRAHGYLTPDRIELCRIRARHLGVVLPALHSRTGGLSARFGATAGAASVSGKAPESTLVNCPGVLAASGTFSGGGSQ